MDMSLQRKAPLARGFGFSYINCVNYLRLLKICEINPLAICTM